MCYFTSVLIFLGINLVDISNKYNAQIHWNKSNFKDDKNAFQ